MSGFDFDPLRDHLAPTPGPRERDAVHARARALHARTRRNRLAASAISLVAVAAVALGIAASQREGNGQGLTVEGGPPPTSTTVPATTTSEPSTSKTAVPTQSAAALSATWVSPDHGWVLEGDGTVAETTDGGRTWQPDGKVPASTSDTRIRFADPSHGYAFDRDQLLETDDGGTTWYDMTRPFHGAADLSIWNGTVYAASYDTTNVTVDVWTTPVGSSTWTKRTTGVPIGAGPVPETQLVLSGSNGWLLQVDRTVVGGAELTATVKWTPWRPPCADTNGPAYLSASTATDLVASCSEGDWGNPPPRATAVYFSHDGGQSFTRQNAPTFGPVMTPNPTTAVVVSSEGIQRTTDEGATWRRVFDSPSSAADLGFTTDTQGFVILTNGEMLMTYDAGATWRRATLP
jgi:photosystem II stability/assembly factor-like uncharacterized protein